MTVYNFNLGGSDGNAASPGNTGAIAITPGSGNSIVLDDDAGLATSVMAVKFHVGATTNSCFGDWAGVSGSPTSLSIHLECQLPATAPPVDTTLYQRYDGAGTTVLFRLVLMTTGVLKFTFSGGSGSTTLVANAAPYYGTVVAVRATLNQSTGEAYGRFYANPLAAVGSYTGSELHGTGLSMGSGGYGKIRAGINTVQTSIPSGGYDFWIDYMNDASGISWLAGPSAPTAPTANAGADQYATSGGSFTLAGSGAIGTSGGAIDGYTWVNTLKPAGAPTPSFATNTASTTVTNIVEGQYDFTLTTHQTGGGLSSAPDSVSGWVSPVSGGAVKPKTITRDPTISREGAVSDDPTALTDSSVNTGFKWPDNPSGQPFWITWNPAGPSDITFDLDGRLADDSSAGTVTVSVTHFLEDGTTTIWGPTDTIINTNSEKPILAGLDPTTMGTLGTSAANRRALKTLITATI